MVALMDGMCIRKYNQNIVIFSSSEHQSLVSSCVHEILSKKFECCNFKFEAICVIILGESDNSLLKSVISFASLKRLP